MVVGWLLFAWSPARGVAPATDRLEWLGGGGWLGLCHVVTPSVASSSLPAKGFLLTAKAGVESLLDSYPNCLSNPKQINPKSACLNLCATRIDIAFGMCNL